MFYGFQPYFNSRLTPFFENTPFLALSNSLNLAPNQWFGALSPKFFRKAHSFQPIKAHELDNFLSNTNKDVVGFNSRSTQPNIIKQAENYHKDYVKAFRMILELAELDFDIDRNSRKLFKRPSGHWCYANIFSNMVIAKWWVWKKFIKEVLEPCYWVMSNPNNTELMEIIWRDSGYNALNRIPYSPRFKKEIGVNYYPYHTFICERFWTMFMNNRPEISMTHYPFL